MYSGVFLHYLMALEFNLPFIHLTSHGFLFIFCDLSMIVLTKLLNAFRHARLIFQIANGRGNGTNLHQGETISSVLDFCSKFWKSTSIFAIFTFYFLCSSSIIIRLLFFHFIVSLRNVFWFSVFCTVYFFFYGDE